jgi:hypothetical protein
MFFFTKIFRRRVKKQVNPNHRKPKEVSRRGLGLVRGLFREPRHQRFRVADQPPVKEKKC